MPIRDSRPGPAELLRRAQEQERRAARGKLKIFFGLAPGVGKTYTMLEEARRLYAQGVDVVIGYVEPHKRNETAILTLGLEVLPTREVAHHNTTIQEFDLDAALARRPAVILVDELAHTNAPGSRFAKRYEDVRALLEAGLNVYTTLNVQHLESQADIVTQITGVEVRETVPDTIFDEAAEVELIDLPPDALLERLRNGKIYTEHATRDALSNFFRKGNLSALRELALRRTAQWVDTQVHDYKSEHGIVNVWPSGERILAGIGGGPQSARIVRAARRLSLSMRCELVVAHVETPLELREPGESREIILQSLHLAQSLGAETVTLTGRSAAEELADFARSRNISKIVVGKSSKPPWLEWISRSVAAQLIQRAGDFDVFVVQGETEADPGGAKLARPVSRNRKRDYTIAIGAVGLTTLIAAWMVPRFDLANVIMVYLLNIIIISATCGRGASVLASILSVAAFDFFCVPPRLTFAVSDTQYLITFTVMLIVALFSSGLTARIREQGEEARRRERRTEALYSMSRELAAARSEDEVMEAGTRHMRETMKSSVAVLLADASGRLEAARADRTAYPLELADIGAAQWAFDHNKIAGRNTATLPAAAGVYLPLHAARGRIGAIGIRPHDGRDFTTHELYFLETLANQLALALERTRLLREAQDAQVHAETERMRNALLSSVSHDLRTPLSVITGTASTLLSDSANLPAETSRSLVESIMEEAARLNQIISNLMFATRLESNTININKDWTSIEEIAGAALHRLRERIANRKIRTMFPEDLPLVRADGVLLEQVFMNLLENALRHTPASTPIEISAFRRDSSVIIKIRDFGPGIPEGDENRIFERFYRSNTGASSPGLGLGLYICRGIINAHGGRIWGESTPGAGAAFFISIPADDAAPAVPAEPPEPASPDPAQN